MKNKYPKIEPGYQCNEWTVLENWKRNKRSQKYWECQCSCGHKRYIVENILQRKKIKKCKKCHITEVGLNNFKDISNEVFGKWIVLERGSTYKSSKHIKWKCKCECGRILEVDRANLLNGDSTSCGQCNNYQEILGGFWSVIKCSAKSRDIPFIITIEQAWDLFLKQGRKCALTGVELSFGSHGKINTTASLDRIDSYKEYTLENVQWVHKIVNICKNALSNEEFFTLCSIIVDNCKKKYNTIDDIWYNMKKLKIGRGSRCDM